MVIHGWLAVADHGGWLVVTVTTVAPPPKGADQWVEDKEMVGPLAPAAWLTTIRPEAVPERTVIYPDRAAPVVLVVTAADSVAPEVPAAVGVNHATSALAVHPPPLVVTTDVPGVPGLLTWRRVCDKESHGRDWFNST